MAEVARDVLVDWMVNRIFGVFVDLRVQTCHVHVFDTLPLGLVHTRVKGAGVGPSAEERVAWPEWFLHMDGGQEGLQFHVCLDLKVPLTFPDDYEVVPLMNKMFSLETVALWSSAKVRSLRMFL